MLLRSIIFQSGLVSSESQGKQLIEQGGVKVNGEVVSDTLTSLSAGEYTISVGSKNIRSVTVKLTG